MRQLVKAQFLKSNIQELRSSIDIRKVLKNKYRDSESSDYYKKDHDQLVSRIKQDIDVDSYTGATTRKTQYQQYYQDQPSLGYVYPMNPGRGAFMEPDCRFTGNDFMEKLNTHFATAITQSYQDLDKVVKIQVNDNKKNIEQNLEKLFREKNPNKEFNFDKEYARYLKLDSKKFKKEYGYETD
ncbi:hypothetical protein ABPG74_013500 [Tetrahymena malaccensis]